MSMKCPRCGGIEVVKAEDGIGTEPCPECCGRKVTALDFGAPAMNDAIAAHVQKLTGEVHFAVWCAHNTAALGDWLTTTARFMHRLQRLRDQKDQTAVIQELNVWWGVITTLRHIVGEFHPNGVYALIEKTFTEVCRALNVEYNFREESVG